MYVANLYRMAMGNPNRRRENQPRRYKGSRRNSSRENNKYIDRPEAGPREGKIAEEDVRKGDRS